MNGTTSQSTLLLPILPGRTEAWMRMMQDVSQAIESDPQLWSETLRFEVDAVELVEIGGKPAAFVRVNTAGLRRFLAWLRRSGGAFEQTLREQIIRIHGVDICERNDDEGTSPTRKRGLT